jgi:hypothetical protein
MLTLSANDETIRKSNELKSAGVNMSEFIRCCIHNLYMDIDKIKKEFDENVQRSIKK